MKKFGALIILLTVVLYGKFGEWDIYSGIKNGNDVCIYDNICFVAADGGILALNKDNLQIYNIIDGIYTKNTSVICNDYRGILWIANQEGYITLFDIDQNSYSYLLDIPQNGQMLLNGIISSKNYIYAFTDEALVRYKFNSNFNKYEIKDLNSMTGNISTTIISNENIYIATVGKIYTINENKENISDINLWSTIDNLPSDFIVNQFAVFNDTVYAFANDGIYKIANDSLVKVKTLNNVIYGYITSNKAYIMVQKTESTVQILETNSFEDDEYAEVWSKETNNINKFGVIDNDIYLLNSDDKIISRYSIPENTEYFYNNFNSPEFEEIKDAAQVNENYLIYNSKNKLGLFDYKNKNWLKNSIPTHSDNKNIFIDGSTCYLSTWGYGIRKYEISDTLKYQSSLKFGHPDISNFYVHPSIQKDSKGNLWIAVWYEPDWTNTHPLVRISADGDTTAFDIPDYTKPYELYIDNNDWIWCGSSDEKLNKADGLAICKVTGNSIESKVIKNTGAIISITKDKDNIVWIGTDTGVKYIDLGMNSITSPLDISSSDLKSLENGPIGSMIYKIKVDNFNQKWFETENGVSVLKNDNSTWTHYVPRSFEPSTNVIGTIVKSKMLDKLVSNVIFPNNEGIALFVSENGFTSYEYSGVTINKNESEIGTIPSPFLNTGQETMKFIIPQDDKNYTYCKIFDIRGRLIKGGNDNKALKIAEGWNGTDNNGSLVSSGIYKIIIYDNSNPQDYLTGKIAVIRK